MIYFYLFKKEIEIGNLLWEGKYFADNDRTLEGIFSLAPILFCTLDTGLEPPHV